MSTAEELSPRGRAVFDGRSHTLDGETTEAILHQVVPWATPTHSLVTHLRVSTEWVTGSNLLLNEDKDNAFNTPS